MTPFTIFGIKSTSKTTEHKWTDDFKLDFREEEDAFYEGKKVFTHDDDGFSFNYQYGINANAYDGKTTYRLVLIFRTESLSPEKLLSVKSFVGNDNPTAYDVSSYGLEIQFGLHTIDGIDTANEGVLNAIATVYESMDGLRGFYLDKPINMIGDNGWTIINDCIPHK